MSQAHHHDPIEDNLESSPGKVAIAVGIGFVAMVIAIILVAQLAIDLYGSRTRKDDPSMTTEAITKRIAPVATVAVSGGPAVAAGSAAAPPAPAPAPAAAPATTAAGAANGKAIYEATCSVCHATGVAGAPKFGDKAAWGPRIAAGKDALHASALRGKGAMPAKGGNAALDEASVKAAVDYMAAAAR